MPPSIPLVSPELTPALYGQLRLIAHRHLGGERQNHTLQATALVHEAYLKLNGVRQRTFADQVHFLAVASRAMRQILVDYARSRAAQKRLGEANRTELPAATPDVKSDGRPDLLELLELDDAL